MKKTVLTFPSKESSYDGRLGGKGENLFILSCAGFQVPPGIIVTSDAYYLWIQEASWLTEAASKFNYQDPAAIEQQSEDIRQKLDLISMPHETVQAIRDGITKLGIGTSFAVRSSSTFEDLADAAFAGQHDTYLNCVGEDEIIKHVKKCWCSLWTSRAILYRNKKGFMHQDASMAVVVQKQIACDVAGVAFSIHPVSGVSHIAAIDANYGIGESVVSGEAPIDHFEIEKKSLKITSSNIASKTIRIVPSDNGTQHEAVPEKLKDIPCLTEPQLSEITQLAINVEHYYGWPQDIEWGIQGEKLYLLQARAITRIPEHWTRDESAERFPKPSTPLSWDYMYPAFQRSLTYSMPVLGMPQLEGDWFQRKGWFIYCNQNAVDALKLHSPIRSHSIEELEKEQDSLREKYQWVLEFVPHWMRDLDRYLIRIGECKARNLSQLTLKELFFHLEELALIASDYFQPNIAISMGQGFLQKALFHVCTLIVGKEKAPMIFDGLISGIDTKTVEVNAELQKLAGELVKFPKLIEAIKLHGAITIHEKRILSEFPDFEALFNTFLNHHGHRELYQDYYYPTWSQDPSVVLDLLMIVADKHDNETFMHSRQGRIKYNVAEKTLLNASPDSVSFFVRELIRLTRSFTALDDLEHYQTTRINPLARDGGLAIGKILVERAILDRADQVFFLSRSELREIVLENKPISKHEITKRESEFNQALHETPAWILGEDNNIDPVEEDGSFKGIPGSPGEITAPCFIIDSTADFSKFPKGSILVARTTNPAWTPLFYLASGVVTESGGPLSHGAVTAREMHLPAVMAVRDILRLVNNGDILRINGSLGLVTKMEKAK